MFPIYFQIISIVFEYFLHMFLQNGGCKGERNRGYQKGHDGKVLVTFS